MLLSAVPSPFSPIGNTDSSCCRRDSRTLSAAAVELVARASLVR